MARFTSGWFKSYRAAWEKDLGRNVYLWAIWNALLHMAHWRESQMIWKSKQRDLPPGSVVMGIKELASRFRCSERTIWKWLKHLHDTGRIALETSERGTLVTILNWTDYQSEEMDTFEPSSSQVRPGFEPGSSEVILIEERRKKNEKKSRSRVEYSDEFEAIYQGYPRSEGKSAGFKVYQRDIKTEEDRDQLTRAIKNYSANKQSTEPRYLMMFNTFMGQWLDWLDAKTGTSSLTGPHRPLVNADELEASLNGGPAL